MKKVVITGIGMLCANGNGKDAAWANIKAGKPGIGRITAFDPSRCTCQVAGEVKDFEKYAIEEQSDLVESASVNGNVRLNTKATALSDINAVD